VQLFLESKLDQNNKEIQVLQQNLKRGNLSEREEEQIMRQLKHLLDANDQLKDQLER
jgi:DnaJ-domain-containing protein 1